MKHVKISIFLGMLWGATAAFAVDFSNGQTAYLNYCAGCHGADGWTVTDAPNLALNPVLMQSEEELVELLNSGRGKMPPYFGILAPQGMIDVIYYMRTLR